MVTAKIRLFENWGAGKIGISLRSKYSLWNWNILLYFASFWVIFSNVISEEEDSNTEMIPETQRGSTHPPAPTLITEEGLIMPRKPHNPVLDNTERQNLHKELLFNQKMWALIIKSRRGNQKKYSLDINFHLLFWNTKIYLHFWISSTISKPTFQVDFLGSSSLNFQIE